MTPGRLWWLVQRDFKRGFRASWHNYVVGPKIWRWRNPHAGEASPAVPVAVVLGREHVTMAAWMLASLITATGRNWHIVLHDDGTVPTGTLELMRTLALDVTLISRADADARMSHHLDSRVRCREYRDLVPLALKIFDAPLLQESERFLLLDPDVLFFRRPAEILRWADSHGDDSCWFNADIAEASCVPAEEARGRLRVELWPRVNSGLCLLARRAIDLDFCEQIFWDTSLLSGFFWRIEQTLFALCASRHARGGLLPEQYEITLTPAMRADAISRHYVGAVRQLFWAEGLRQLHRQVCP